jgi:hypothetical protein
MSSPSTSSPWSGWRADTAREPRRTAGPAGSRARASAPEGAAVREGAERDPAEDRRGARELNGADRVAEGQRAGQRADHRLEVEERASHLGGHARLAHGEQREGHERAREGQPEQREHDARPGRRPGQRLEREGDRQREERAGGELHGGDRRGVAPAQERGLVHDVAGRQHERGEHERVAAQRRLAPAACGHEPHATEREREARPGQRAGDAAPERHGEERDEHRPGAHDERGVAHARLRDARVLQHDDHAEAQRAPQRDGRRGRRAQGPPAGQGQQRGGEPEARHGEPRGVQPAQGELGQRHGGAPQDPGGGQGVQRGAAIGVHGPHRRSSAVKTEAGLAILLVARNDVRSDGRPA